MLCAGETDCTTTINTQTFEYTQAGMIERITNSDDSTREYQYNEDNRPLSTTWSNSTGNTFSYVWRTDGRLDEKHFVADDAYVRQYTYDNGVLTEAAYELSTTVYNYTRDADACALLRAWPIRFLDAFYNATSQELMMINYGDGRPTNVLW